jgi:cytochrome b6-f complex iron-sulfur subunit
MWNNKKLVTAMPAIPPNLDSPTKTLVHMHKIIHLNLSRRDFLGLAWKSILSVCGFLGLGALWHYFNFQDEPAQKTEFDLGMAENYALGNHLLIPEAQAFLLHTAGGFLAISIICPHLGCLVEPTLDGFVCPCHTSRFDQQGALKVGPATSALRFLRLEQTPDGHLILHIR